jgi:hypothetical protein
VSTLTDQQGLSIPAETESPPKRFDKRLVAILSVAMAGLAALAVGIAVGLRAPEAPPATGAAALVPSDALAYIHLSTDPTRPAVKPALRLAGRFPDAPTLIAGLNNRLGEILSPPGAPVGTFDFDRDVRPWLGKEAAFALLNTPSTTAGSLIVLDVRSRPRAQAFLDRSGATPVRVYRGVTELRYRPGTVLAFVGHYLALGQRSSVKSAIDAARGSSRSLQGNPAYQSAASAEPADRVLDAYISAAGLRRVLAPRGGVLRALATLLLKPAVEGTTISLAAARGGARVTVHSALDPTLARLSGPPAPLFTPALTSLLPARSPLVLDVKGLSRSAPTVLAATASAGIAGRIGPLLHRLGTALVSEGVDVHKAVSLFSGETAVAMAPPAPSSNGASRGSALVIVTRTAHQEATRQLLASLQGPLAQLFPPPSTGPGQAAEWSDVQVAGVNVHQLSIAPGLQLDYAVFRGLVVVSTSLRGLGDVARHARSLAHQPAYRAALGAAPDRVTSLLFLDFSQLLSLGEQMGLTRSPRLSALRPDLEKIQATGLASTRGEADTTAELFLQIS